MAVTLHTDLGDMKIELEVQKCPKTCENFLALCSSGKYDGCTFHRIIRTFCCQTGDPTNTGKGGLSIWGRPFNDEIDHTLKHTQRGVVAMATSRPNHNNSQFYITFTALPHLNGRATVFGKVIDGLEVLDDIERLKVDDQVHWKPEIDITIKFVTVHANPIAEGIDFET